MIRAVLNSISAMHDYLRLPKAARREHSRDFRRVPRQDSGIPLALEEAVAWLGRAQDCSLSGDGGVAHCYSLVRGWTESYPETTGYIVPTLLACAKAGGKEALRLRAIRMLDWLISIQLPSGAFQGGTVYDKPVPTAFNTGQILLGLAFGTKELQRDRYHAALCRAADWLVKVQDPDGCWRQGSSPLVVAGERVYDTHIAWALLEAARVESGRNYAESALANVRWALRYQSDNGWFDRCCLQDASRPLTHTLGYALRGILEAYRFTGDPALLTAAWKTADGLLSALSPEGFLPGRLDRYWRKAVSWSCLTGTVQVATCWFMTYLFTGQERYREAAYAANRYVRRTQRLDGPAETRGAIKGSFPIYGSYLSYCYPNWACKFFIDANMLEQAVRKGDLVPYAAGLVKEA